MLASLARLTLLSSIVLAACSPAQNARPTSTPLTLPSRTPIVVSKPQTTATSKATPTETASPQSAATPLPTPTELPPASGASIQARATSTAADALSHDAAPGAIQRTLASAGIDSNVYWFTFGGEDMLMIQYASPIANRPGYAEMLQAVKTIAAQRFLKIDPPLYSMWVAATDLTGTSDTVLRLRRDAVERWASGEIGAADFYNNGFEPARIVVTCTQAGECSAVKPTPYPTFPPFPFPFPTPTP